MIALLRRRPFIAGLAVVAAALAVLLAFEIGDASRSRIPTGASKPAAPAPAKLLPGTVAVAPDQAYPETVARPLFIPTRRPAPPQAVVTAPTFVRGQFQLLGVIIAGNSKTAMLREKASGKIHRVEQGRDLNGIKISSIERDTVTLAQGGESEVVAMQVQKGAPGTAAASTAAGPFAQPGAAPGQPAAGQPAPTPAQQAAAAHPTPPPIQIPPASAALLGIPQPGTAPATPPGTPPATSAPMTPEELLARRRARRAQPNQ
jgi:general secretion pathway protein N